MKENGPKIFNNTALEIFTKSNPAIHIGFYGALVFAYIALSVRYSPLNWWQGILLFLSALFFWTFAEYMLHRYVFHWADESKWGKRFQYIVHGVHHEYPREKLFMPPLPGLIISSLFLIIFTINFAIFGQPTLSFIFMAGFLFGYLSYSLIHYSTHKVKPPSFLRDLWTHHLLHHYQCPDKAFGVSSRFWDRVFNTMPKKKNIV
jgi:sterol desaturase/sphingolipid hydroxylase (fatty acid hydroxylase superfamily)